MVKDSILYIDAGEDTKAIDDSLRQDIFRLRQVPMGDTTNLSSHAPLYVYYTTSADNVDKHGGIPLPFALEQTDGIFGLILFCFLIFTHVYQGGFSFLKENIRLLFSPEKSQKKYRQTTTVKEVWYTYFLMFQAVVLISICLYDIFMEFSPLGKAIQTPFLTIVAFIILISIFLLLKVWIYRFIGYVFDLKFVMAGWSRSYVTIIEMLGIFCFIPTLLLIYSNYLHLEAIIVMAILFLIAQLILFYRIIIFFISEKFNFLYLIAYLCTIEILPYVFLSIGLIYLYRFDVYSILWLLK